LYQLFFGREFREYDLTTIQTENEFNLLVIHDANDTTIPYLDSIRMKDRYNERCEHMKTDGLGHRKIMHDPKILQKIVDTIKSSE